MSSENRDQHMLEDVSFGEMAGFAWAMAETGNSEIKRLEKLSAAGGMPPAYRELAERVRANYFAIDDEEPPDPMHFAMGFVTGVGTALAHRDMLAIALPSIKRMRRDLARHNSRASKRR